MAKAHDSELEQLVGELIRSLQRAVADGDLPALTGAAKVLKQVLPAARDDLDALLRDAEGMARRGVTQFEQALRDGAEKRRCELSIRPPHYQVGAITFTSRKTGEWELSVLNGPTLERIGTVKPGPLLERIDTYLADIDRRRKSPKLVEDALVFLARKRASEDRGSPVEVDVNTLLLIVADGSSVARRLSHGAHGASPGCRRHELGFVLADMLRARSDDGKESPIARLETRGATQMDTKSPQSYLEIPTGPSPDPHRICVAKPVRALHLTLRQGGRRI
jgi:hypothetical protein